MMKNTNNIKKLIKALEQFREIDPAITLPSMLALLYYHDIENNSGNRSIVEERMGMSGATASRATLYWSEFKAPRIKGQDMLTFKQDPSNRRMNIVQYNRKGVEFLERMNEVMD